MNTINDSNREDDLVAHVRRTLRTVAETVVIEDSIAPSTDAVRSRPRRVLVVALAGLFALGIRVAWKHLDGGEITRIPTESALMSGTADRGGDWWIIPSELLHPSHYPKSCDPPPAAVDFVTAANNRPGDEWNTGGVQYGETSAPPDTCPKEASWLSNPVHFSMGFSRVRPSNNGGDDHSDWGYFLATHPRVTEIEVTVDGDQPFVVRTVTLPARPDGPRFAGFTVAYDARSVTVKLLDADGQVLSGQVTRPGG